MGRGVTGMTDADRERLEAVSEALVVVLNNQERIMRALSGVACRDRPAAEFNLTEMGERATFTGAFARGYAGRIDALSRRPADPA